MQNILHEQKYRSQKVSEVVKVTKQHTFPINGSFHEYFTVTFRTQNFCTLLLKEICKKAGFQTQNPTTSQPTFTCTHLH